MVRYRTRDPDAPAATDRAQHAAHEKITGRSDDMLIIRGVNLFRRRSRN
jgi:phenylacetate-coenzyme A ligase PaaK-like adenylate-forming protein